MWQPGLLLVGLYAWTVTMACGATLLDVANAAQDTSSATGNVGEAGDLLLAIAALTVLAAIGAIAAAWEWKQARYLLVASLIVVVAGLMAPALLSTIIRDADSALGIRLGPWVRVGDAGLSSVLAFIGLWVSWRKGRSPAQM